MKTEVLGEKIKKAEENINQHLKDTSSSLWVDFSLGAINIIPDFGCVYNLYQGLSREEILRILTGMSLVLALKEKERK